MTIRRDVARDPEALAERAALHFARTALDADLSGRVFSVALSGGSTPLRLFALLADGHTASLFPGSPLLRERRALVAPAINEKTGSRRLTLTLPVLNAAARVIFLAAGREKAAAVRSVLSGRRSLPASRVRPAHGELCWLLDRAAAGQ